MSELHKTTFRLGQLLAYVTDVHDTLKALPGYTLNKDKAEVMEKRCIQARELILQWAEELESK